MQTVLSKLNIDSGIKISQISFEMGKGKYCFPLRTFKFSPVFSFTFTLQAEPSILTSPLSFPLFSCQSFHNELQALPAFCTLFEVSPSRNLDWISDLF